MKLRYIALLVVLAVAVGGAGVYAFMRKPERPTAAAPVPCPPDAKDCAPGTRVDQPAPVRKTPNSSADYHRPEESN